MILALDSSVQAQDSLRVSWGQEIEDDRDYQFVEIIGSTPAYFYTLHSSKKLNKGIREFVMEIYDQSTLSRLNRINLVSSDQELIEFEKVSVWKSGIVMIYSKRDHDLGNVTMYARTFNERGEKSGTDVKLETIRDIVYDQSSGKIDIISSNDKSKWLIAYPYKKVNSEKVILKLLLYDDDFDKLWEREIKLEYLASTFKRKKTLLDNFGNIHVVAITRSVQGLGRFNLKKPIKSCLIVSYNHEINKINELELNLPEEWITSVSAGLDSLDNLIVGGTYARKNKNVMNGTFYLKINPGDFEILVQKLIPFEQSLKSKLALNGRRSNVELFEEYFLREFHVHQNGSLSVLAEEYYVEEECIEDPRTGQLICNFVYYFGDILMLKIGENGDHTEVFTISKLQQSHNKKGELSSFAGVPTDGGFLVIFNDNYKNQGVRLNSPYKIRDLSNFNKSEAYMMHVQNEKLIAEKPLIASEDEKFDFVPAYNHMDEDSMLIYIRIKEKKYKFGKVTNSINSSHYRSH